jgi:hypothetical protein
LLKSRGLFRQDSEDCLLSPYIYTSTLSPQHHSELVLRIRNNPPFYGEVRETFRCLLPATVEGCRRSLSSLVPLVPLSLRAGFSLWFPCRGQRRWEKSSAIAMWLGAGYFQTTTSIASMLVPLQCSEFDSWRVIKTKDLGQS